MIEKVEKYSDADLAEFKILIEAKIKKSQETLALLERSYKNDGDNGTEDTAPSFKPLEASNLSKEVNVKLAIRQEKFLRDLKNALIRIEHKTYGICRVTGKKIKKARLQLVPHTTLSIEAKNLQKD